MLICIFVIVRILPDMPSNYKGTYTGLMKSVFTLVKENATLRLVSLRAGICFGCFLTLWACLAFKMSGAPFTPETMSSVCLVYVVLPEL